MITLRQVEFGYGPDFRLRVPAITVRAGERVALVGPSGVGKTTLAHLMAGILRPNAGQITVAEHRISDLGDAARRAFRVRRIGMVFQRDALLEYLTAEENVLLPFRINPALTLDDAARARAAELLAQMGLGASARRRPRALSHGERQRVALCRALVTHPTLIIADEPTASLDPNATSRVMDALFDSVGAERTLLMVTHDPGVLHRFDRTIDVGEFVQ